MKFNNGQRLIQSPTKHLRWSVLYKALSYSAQKMKFSIKDFFSKCKQIGSLIIFGFDHIY